MAEPAQVPCIYVLAGVNGAGKSSIGGSAFRDRGGDYFNPDEAARRIQQGDPNLSQEEANSAAWHESRRLLERAIEERLDFAFETTLGGRTIARLLETALDQGIEVRMWYAGLNSPDLHVERVRKRHAMGGHSIPEATVRKRYETSRLNLIRLLPKLTELRVYDNSMEADPAKGQAPRPRLVLHLVRGRTVGPDDLRATPDWAKPVAGAALKLSAR